jgi:hypothetical protein
MDRLPGGERNKNRAGNMPHPVCAGERGNYVCDVTQWLPPLVVELLLQIGCTA